MSKLDEILKNADAYKKEARKIIDEALEKGKSFLIEGMNAVFEEYEQLESISWTQYTPYFNDGDPCEFSSNIYSIELNDLNEYADKKELKEKLDNFSNILSKIRELISIIGDDVLELLGEGKVIVRRDGTITIDEYDHD